MNKQMIFRTALGVALLSGCAAIHAKPPTCAQPVGKWSDESQSIIEIETYDTATGALSGQFISPSEGASWPIVGWINRGPAASSTPGKAGKGDHADVVTLAVRWGEYGSVTAWTGTCTVNAKSGFAQISTLWHTSRPNTEREWQHTLTGPEVLVPIE